MTHTNPENAPPKTTISHADELRAAAVLLRELVQRATHENRPRWSTGRTLGSRSPVVVDHPEEPSVLIETYAARLEAVNRYIAAMGPSVGAALAELLEYTARFAGVYDELHWAETGDSPADPHPDPSIRHALTVARNIRGVGGTGQPGTPPDTSGHTARTSAPAHSAPTEPDDAPLTTSPDTTRTRPDTDTPDTGHGVRITYTASVPRHQLGAAIADALHHIAAETHTTNPGSEPA